MLPVVDGTFGTLFWTAAVFALAVYASKEFLQLRRLANQDFESAVTFLSLVGIVIIWIVAAILFIRFCVPVLF